MYPIHNYMQISIETCLVETFGTIQNGGTMEKFSFLS